MHQITELRCTWEPHLGWHGARVTFLALFLVALYRFKTVNLARQILLNLESRMAGYFAVLRFLSCT
ncbi:MAG: hypothetical protein KME13_12200 [Myxacorys californica WJT36-NPBG1]|jgi:hypothetical protein|nr:hypothetical protein [Myxacorys californica WJT36-NPBG1]